MNNDDASSNLPNAKPEPTDSAASRDAWRTWMRRLLVCNPFFLSSAALLLYAVNRLSSMDSLFTGEIHNLVFNFSALQFYETLVVIAGIVLARRKIWYDSSLLVVVEQGLVLVPFLLISQATVQGQELNEGMALAWTLALAGVGASAARMLSIRKWFPQFNLPPRALLLGAAILAGNIALPLVFRVRMEKDLLDWQEENQFLWHYVMPALVFGACLLAKPRRYGGSSPERHWLPIFIYALWFTGSAVHVWSIAHICSLPLEPHHLAPLGCAIVSTLWHRLQDFVPNPAPGLRRAILIFALLAPVPAVANSPVFAILAAATHLGFLILWLRSADTWPLRSTTGHLAVVSLTMLLAGFPVEWAQAVIPNLDRSGCVIAAWSAFALLHATRSRSPAIGLAAAATLAMGMAVFSRTFPALNSHVIIESSAMFLLLHSIRWPSREPAAEGFLRVIAASLWLLDAATWTSGLQFASIGFTTTGGLLMLAAWWIFRAHASILVAIAPIAVVCCAPAHWLFRHASAGAIALLASLILFAVGMAFAWTRHRWEARDNSAPH